MSISYKPLWHLLVEKEMSKKDLKEAAKITNNVIARMGKDAYVNLETIEKICLALNCNVEDVICIYRVRNKNEF